jgi:hypothetical protein
MKKMSFLFAALALTCTIIFTANVAKAQDAGCGLGSMLIQDNSKLMQLFAMTTNEVTGSQSFGITTGTSNCKAESFVMREKAIQYFAEVNKTDLSREMAQGQGEKLATLASLYGCKGSAKNDFSKMTQSSFGKILPTNDTATSEMVRNLNRELESNSELSKSCQAI